MYEQVTSNLLLHIHPGHPHKDVGNKQRGKEERGEAAKAVFKTVCRYKRNQSPEWWQCTSVFIQFFIPFIMYIEINLPQRLEVLNRVLEEAPPLKPKILPCWFWRKTRLVVIFFIKTSRFLKY